MNAAFLKLQREENGSLFVYVCIKAIPQFTTQHVWRVWLVVFTAGYPRAQCGLIFCVCMCLCCPPHGCHVSCE